MRGGAPDRLSGAVTDAGVDGASPAPGPALPGRALPGRATAGYDGVRGVLLDVDDTLVDTRAAFAAGIDAVAAAYLPHLDAGGRARALDVWRADAQGAFRRYTRGELSQSAQRLLRAQEVHEALAGPAIPEETFGEWEAVYLAGFESGWRAHEDALDAVAALRSTGLAVGALTNASRAMQTRKLAATGFADDVPLLVTLDELGVGKPDPRVFLEACRLLGTEPGETLYVGDELDTDALAAQRAGLRAVWLDRPGARRGGVHLEDPHVAREAGIVVVHSLGEVPGLLGL